MSKYAKVKIGQMEYSYLTNNLPVGMGDIVKVPVRHNRRVQGEVVSLTDERPDSPRLKSIDKIVKAATPPPEPVIDEEIPDMTGDSK